jgi:hypothetical protein
VQTTTVTVEITTRNFHAVLLDHSFFKALFVQIKHKNESFSPQQAIAAGDHPSLISSLAISK